MKILNKNCLIIRMHFINSTSSCKYNKVYRATAEAIAASKTKRDRVAELHYITRGARNVKDANFEAS